MKKFKKGISLLLTVLMVVGMLPIIPTAAATVTTAITVESTTAKAGDENVEVNIFISNNPGIPALELKINYDESAMTLTEMANGEAFNISGMNFTPPKGEMPSGSSVTWFTTEVKEANIKNGCLLKLKFDILAEAANDVYPITVTCVDIVDNSAAPIAVNLTNGSIEILDYYPGDADGNGNISVIDALYICRYVVGGYGINVNKLAADANGDGKISVIDALIVCRSIAGGYNVKPKPGLVACDHASLTAVEAKAATCIEDGNTAYWTCNDCDKYFSNETATNQIEIEDTVVTAGHIPGEEATCTEAQTCEKCGGVLKVANGHTEVTVSGYAATTEKEGLTDGIKCSVCGEWVVEQEVIDKLLPEQYSITYILNAGDYIDQGDAYLQKQIIDNPNPKNFTANELIELKKLSTPGYTFDGWLDQSGKRWDVIPVGTTQNLVLYAKWTQNVYTVSFDTPDVEVSYTWYDANLGTNVNLKNSAKYTIDTGLTLENPKAHKYTFVGWSNDEGFIVDRIRPGTTDNITLHANWTSDRNRTTSYSDYGEPIIIEDNDRRQFLFVYNIGKIDNVPLYTYLREDGKTEVEYHERTVDFTETSTLKSEFKKEDAQNVAKIVANSTTRSSGWTLSEEWKNVITDETKGTNIQIKSEERTDSQGTTVGDKFFISNSKGGSSHTSVESGSSSSNSAKITTEDSFGINTSYDKATEKYCEAELKTGFKNENELSAGISAPVGIAEVSAGVKNTTTITADATLTSGRKDNKAFHVDTNSSSYVGTDFSSSSASHYNALTSNTTNWNSTDSYEKSSEMSKERTVAAAIAEEIEKTTTYNISNALSKAKDNTESVSGMTSDETGYSNSVTVSEYFSDENVYVDKHTDNNVGHHRLVEAGIVHVYAVVGYDIATASYYTYTFNVLEDDTYPYWDYSISDPRFADCENGLITFEIPYEVNEYIAGVTGQTEGLEIGIAEDGYGCVNKFETPENFEGDVVVPQYLGANNLDGTYDPVVVTSFEANVFRDNKEIKTVILPMYITKIPAYAFEGCTNLETVIAYGVTEIGEYAFKDCTNLGKFVTKNSEETDTDNSEDIAFSAFMLDNKVTTLGEGAFEGVNEIKVMAYDSNVADAAMKSGAKRITLDLTKLSDDYSGEKSISSSTEYFKLIGGGKTFSGLKIKSDAKETFISNMTLTDNSDIPLELASETVTLARVTVENAPGLALSLKAENTALKLYQTITLTSQSNNSVLSRNVSLSKANSGITGTLNFSGKYLVCGEIVNTGMLKYPENVKTISEDEYEKYLSTVLVNFDVDKGSAIASVELAYDTKLAVPQSPTKDHYSFLGWYSDKDCTTEFDFSTPITSNTTVYAKWKLNEYLLTFDANGGSVAPQTAEVLYGTAYGALPTPTREGFDFDGWHNANNELVTAETEVIAMRDHILTAHWSAKAFSANWNNADNSTITVTRTASPYANAAIGTLSSGETVYYGDVLAVSYAAANGYSVAASGIESVTVTENITSDDIYATVTPNAYTYNIVYRSTNGTDLGSDTVTNNFATTNTVLPKAVAGYTTPKAQSVAWDSTNAKTITFTYTPVSVSDSQQIDGGALKTHDHTGVGSCDFVTYTAVAKYRNRTATSVEILVEWTSTLKAEHYLGYTQTFAATVGGISVETVQLNSNTAWADKASTTRSKTATTSWITVPVSATQSSVNIYIVYDDAGEHFAGGREDVFIVDRPMTIPTF